MLCWLIVYKSSSIVGNIGSDSNDNNSSDIDSDDFWAKRTNSVLGLVSDPFSRFNISPL